ncbi:CHAT domain-containing protein [Streptomyces zhihengii]|uniref:CHAT domain-containing protein n=1 Tax=Streptomyces zhihengii TaxID=1818004 RepID=UPI003456CB8B
MASSGTAGFPAPEQCTLALRTLLTVAEESAAVAPGAARDALSAAGFLLLTLCRLGAGIGLLMRAAEVLRTVTAPRTADPGDPGPSVRDLDHLGTVAYRLWKGTTDAAFLAESVDGHRRAAEASSGARRIEPLDHLGAALHQFARLHRDPSALGESSAAFREAMALTPEGSDAWWTLAGKLATVAQLVPEITGPGPALDAALDEQRALIRGDRPVPWRITQMGSVLVGARHLMTGALSDLDEQIDLARRAASRCPAGEDRALIVADLGAALASRFERTAVAADLEEAVRLMTSATAGAPEYALHTLRQNLRQARDRLAAVTAAPAAVPSGEEAARDPLTRAAELGDLYQFYGNAAHLDEAIRVLGPAVETSQEGGHDAASSAGHLFVLGRMHALRAQITGGGRDLDDAVAHGRRAVDVVPTGTTSPYSVDELLSGLADTLRIRFEQRGDPADLDEAVGLLREALRLDGGVTSEAIHRNRLGLVLQRRHECNHDLPDLLLAVRVLTEASGAEVSSALKASIAGNLGSAHSALHGRSRRPADLDSAILHYRVAVEHGPPRSPHRPTRLANLAMALHQRYASAGDAFDLNEALEAAANAVDGTLAEDVERGRRLLAHADLVFSRYQAAGHPADLTLVLELGRTALTAVPGGQAHRAEMLLRCARNEVRVADALRSMPAGTGPSVTPSDLLDRVLGLYDEARQQTSALGQHRAEAARQWARVTARQDLPAALDGAVEAFGLLAAVDWHGMRIADRISLLSDWSGFPCEAAAWAVGAGRGDEALRILELGRGRLWAQITDTRTPLLPDGDAAREVAAELEAVHRELAELTRARVENGPLSPGTGTRGERLGRLNARRRDLLSRLRALEEPVNMTAHRDPTAALTDGPAVIVNMSAFRCDALVVHGTDDGAAIDVIPLDTTLEETSARVRAFGGALAAARTARGRLLADRRHGRPGDAAVRAAYRAAVDEVGALLAWGWDTITGPALEAADRVLPRAGTTGPARRIRWVPTGPLTGFPLHATGRHDGSGRAVLDRVVSSEAVTLNILSRARHAPRATGPARLLVAGVPRPRGTTRSLAGVRAEAATVAARSPLPVTRLDDTATREAILTGLPTHTWFHFAGHGTTGISDPGDAALSAFDAPVTLADVAGAVRTDAELAFLSSCHGATPGPGQPDEVLHLAAAFHATGFRHVVAALYAVDDLVAERVATGFYDELRRVADPGLALHRTLVELRAALAREHQQDELVYPYAWIGHTHLGPSGSVTEPAPAAPLTG